MPFVLDTATAVARIRERNPVLNAYVTTRLDHATREARQAGERRDDKPLAGVPYGLKDEWDTAGIATTAGSHRHRERVPDVSHPVHVAFEEAGAILVGKTNLSDLGLAPEASSWVGGSARNPHDPTRTAGGSSGGAAAAVADGMQSFDWGTDIGGSIRLPAGFCGIFGLRLSSATWPIESLFPNLPEPLAWMAGQGPMTRTIGEMREVMRVAAPTLRKREGPPWAVKRVLLHPPAHAGAWPTFCDDVAEPLRRAAGVPVELATGLPSTKRVGAVYDALWSSHFEHLLDCDPTLGFFDGMRAVLSSVVLRGRLGDRRMHPATAELVLLIALGRVTIYRDSRTAMARAKTVRDAYERAWDRGDLVVAPTCAYPAPKVGRSNYNRRILACTAPGNIADTTGLAVPFGRFANGLPRALQLMGPPGSEDRLVDLAERLVADAPGPIAGGSAVP